MAKAKCPWSAHEVRLKKDVEVGDTGTCGTCDGRYRVAAIDPIKLKRRIKS